MKISIAVFIFFVFVLINCSKSVAIEEDMVDNSYHIQKVGASARDLLTNDRYETLKIEVQYMPGYEPDAKALENLRSFLLRYLHKPGGIIINTKEIPAVTDTVLTIENIKAIEQANRLVFNKSKELSVYIIYTNGYFIDQHMLGYAYQNTSAVIFGKNIHENSNAYKKPSRTQLESRVLQHELGHLLGLVNVGTPLQSHHKDDAHGKHCINKNCLMYYLTDTEVNPSMVIKKTIPKLDKECVKDLIANGGKR